MIKTAVIGFGLSARTFHLPFITSSEAFELVAISTSQTEAAQQAYPQAQIFAEARDLLLSHLELELVIITAPNKVHFELAQLALQQNLHVVLEKPFVNTSSEARQLIALAAQQEKMLSVYHNRRWDSDFLTLQQLIQSQELGTVHFLASHFDRFRPQPQDRWREQPGPGAGVWYDLGSHLLDQALVLFGEPQALTARCLALRAGAKVTDYFQVQLHYPEKEVVLQASPFVAGPRLRFELQGNRGRYLKYGLDPQEERLKAGVLPLASDWSAEPVSAYGTVYTETNQRIYPACLGGYQAYYQQLAQAIIGQGPVPVPAEEALRVIEWLELAELSSARGQRLSMA